MIKYVFDNCDNIDTAGRSLWWDIMWWDIMDIMMGRNVTLVGRDSS